MRARNSIVMRAPVARIFALACAVERWPEILPHYRWVREVERHGERRVVEMAAHRDGFPVRWWAEQVCEPDVPRITFRHVRGVTRGMEVEWSFTPTDDGVLVRIDHELRLGWPLIGGLVADYVIGPLFISNIAGKTLRRIKQLAESGT
jgi:ribosome-associated toxin RatA of RatAB toxin-antitoxin module